VQFILGDLLRTGKTFASKSDFIRSHQLKEDLSLKYARFENLHLKVAARDSGYELSASLDFYSAVTCMA